jgi:hypothetical protein
MKKIYLSAVAMMAMTTMSIAQVQQEVATFTAVPKGTIVKANGIGLRAATDTLGWGVTPTAMATQPCFACASGTIYTFTYTGGGYVFGCNVSGNNFDGNAQGYLYTGAAKVEGVLMLACGKTVGAGHSAASSFAVNLYNWSATGGIDYNGGSPLQIPGPSTVAATTNYLFDNLDTNFLAYNVATFTAPYPIMTNDFAVGVTGYTAMKTTYGDTIGFHCDALGDAGGLNYAFHKVGSSWYASATIFSSGGNPMDVDIALFPIIENVTSVEEAAYFQGMKMWPVYPNPSNTVSTLTYELENASDNVTLKVIDMKGAVVSKNELGAQGAGKHNFNLDAAKLQSGSYYFMLTCDKGTLTQKFIVER